MHNVDDMESIFKVEEGKPFATVDNVKVVNEAIDHLRELLSKHRADIQWEYNMQVVAATSPLAWLTVKQYEGGQDLPASVTISNEDIRKAEKEYLSYSRDLRSALSAKKRINESSEGLYGENKRGRGSYRGRGVRGRGGYVSSSRFEGATCAKCGSGEHFVAQCDK